MSDTFTDAAGRTWPAPPDNARGISGLLNALFHREGKDDGAHVIVGETVQAWLARAVALAAPVAK
jgi:hypothetical protein